MSHHQCCKFFHSKGPLLFLSCDPFFKHSLKSLLFLDLKSLLFLDVVVLKPDVLERVHILERGRVGNKNSIYTFIVNLQGSSAMFPNNLGRIKRNLCRGGWRRSLWFCMSYIWVCLYVMFRILTSSQKQKE